MSEQQLPLDLPPTPEELDLRPKQAEQPQPTRKPIRVCIGNCDICRYCANSNNRG